MSEPNFELEPLPTHCPLSGQPITIIHTEEFYVDENGFLLPVEPDPEPDTFTTPTGTIALSQVRSELGFGGSINMNDWRVRHLAADHNSGTSIAMSQLKGRNARFAISMGLAGRHDAGRGKYGRHIYLYCRGAPPYVPVTCWAGISSASKAWLDGHGNKSGSCNSAGNLDIHLGRGVFEHWTGEETSGTGNALISSSCRSMNITRGTNNAWLA